MLDFRVHGSIKIRDAKKHSQGGILPESPNAVTKRRKTDYMYILAGRKISHLSFLYIFHSFSKPFKNI